MWYQIIGILFGYKLNDWHYFYIIYLINLYSILEKKNFVFFCVQYCFEKLWCKFLWFSSALHYKCWYKMVAQYAGTKLWCTINDGTKWWRAALNDARHACKRFRTDGWWVVCYGWWWCVMVWWFDGHYNKGLFW